MGWIAWGRRKLYGHGAVPQGCPKVRRILEIWASGMGVISLHCFQSSVPAEAYTREGCMLEALGEWGMGFGGTGPTFLYGSRGCSLSWGTWRAGGPWMGLAQCPKLISCGEKMRGSGC